MLACALTHVATIVATGVSIPLLASTLWIGFLFHRTLSLPKEQQKHGLQVLRQLSELLRAWPRRPK